MDYIVAHLPGRSNWAQNWSYLAMDIAIYILLTGWTWYLPAIGLIAAGILTTRRVADPATQLAIGMFTSLAGSLWLAQTSLHGLNDYFRNGPIIWLSVELILLAIPPAIIFLGGLAPARIAISVGLLALAIAAAVSVLATTGIVAMIADRLIRAVLVQDYYGTPHFYWEHHIRTDVFNSIAPLVATTLFWVFWLAVVGRLLLTPRSLPVVGGAVIGAAAVALTGWLLWSQFHYASSTAASPILTLEAALVLAIWRSLIVIGRGKG
jgi:hypothetical protein